MIHANQSNRFFREDMNANLNDFTTFTFGWIFKEESNGNIAMPNFGKLFLISLLLTPILLPAIFVSFVITLVSPVIKALIHYLSLAANSIVNSCSNLCNRSMFPV